MLKAGVALNSICLEDTKAIFKTVEKEILQDKSPNVAAFSKSFIRTNNTFNPSSSATLKRCPEETFGTTDGKKARASLPIVSPSNSYSYSNGYGGNTTKVYFYIFGTAIVVAYLAKSLLKSSGSSGTTASSSSSSSSAVSSTSTSSYSYSLSYSGSAAQGAFGKGMFRFAPKTSVLQKPWFKYTFARGGFF